MDATDNLLDAMLRANAVDYSAPDAPTTGAAANTGLPPSVAALLAQTQQPAPTLPQPSDQATQDILPLTLLRFAASVTRPRMGNESTTGQVLGSAYDAAGYNSELRAQAQQKAIDQEKERRQMAVQDAELQRAKLQSVGSAQTIVQNAARAPLEIENLRTSVEKAKTDMELTNISIRLNKVKEKYAEQEAQAALDERQAKTEEAKAQAAQENATATLRRKQAEELLAVIELKKNPVKAYTSVPGIPGVTPDRLLDTTTGQMYTPPRDPADALQYAKKQVQAMKDAGEIKTKEEENAAIRDIYNKAKAGNLPPPGQKGSAPQGTPPGAQPTSASSSATASAGATSYMKDSAYQKAVQDSLQSPSRGFVVDGSDGMKHYVIGGREVDAATFQSRLAPNAARATPAPATAYPGKAAATAAAATKPGFQQMMQQQADLGNQISHVQAALQTPNLTPQQRGVLALQLQDLMQKREALRQQGI